MSALLEAIQEIPLAMRPHGFIITERRIDDVYRGLLELRDATVPDCSARVHYLTRGMGRFSFREEILLSKDIRMKRIILGALVQRNFRFPLRCIVEPTGTTDRWPGSWDAGHDKAFAILYSIIQTHIANCMPTAEKIDPEAPWYYTTFGEEFIRGIERVFTKDIEEIISIIRLL